MRGGTMNFETVAVIYIVKNSVAIDTKINAWMNKFLHNDSNYQRDRLAIEKIMRNTIADYLTHCDDVKQEINRYFLYRYENFIHDEFSVMAQFIQNIHVKHNGEYINGFNEEQLTNVIDSMENI